MFEFEVNSKKGIEILCVGAHSDDIEIGCGGTLLKWLNTKKISKVNWIIFSAEGERKEEAKKSAKLIVPSKIDLNIYFGGFRDSFFPFEGSKIKEYYLSIKKKINPDLIFTNYRNDLHQDHKLVSDLTYNLFRDNVILEYEIPKYDGDLGNPNIFVNLDENIVNRKFQIINECFISQRNHIWFSKDKLSALNILRGIESNNGSIFTEAFYSRKAILK